MVDGEPMSLDAVQKPGQILGRLQLVVPSLAGRWRRRQRRRLFIPCREVWSTERDDEQVERLNLFDPVLCFLPRPLCLACPSTSSFTRESSISDATDGVLVYLAASEEAECARAEEESLQEERCPQARVGAGVRLWIEPDQRGWNRWTLMVVIRVWL